MKKIFSIVILSFLIAIGLEAQIQLNIGSGEVDANQNLAIDVKVSNFTQMSSMQFSLNWDSTAFSFVSVTNIVTLTGFEQESFGKPGDQLIKNGQLGVTWYDASGKTLANDTRLFTLNLRAKNQPCKMSSLALTDNPTEILFVNSNLDIVTYTAPAGSIKIKGTDCGGGNTTDLTITAATVFTQPNTKICVPVTVKNFVNVEALQGTFKWDPAVITFLGAENMAFANKRVFNDVNASAGLLAFLYEDGGNPKTLAADAKFMDLCFTAIGANGTSSAVALTSDLSEWSYSATSGSTAINLVNGRVTISTTSVSPVKLNAATTTVNENSEVCVDFTVGSFNAITALQFGIQWDPTILEFVRVDNLMLPNLNNGSFNRLGNTMRLSWVSTNTNPVTLADGSKIFQICFKGIGPCAQEQTSAISIIPEILVGDSEGDPLPFEVKNGAVKINKCGGGTCSVVSVKNVSCNAGNDGGINVTVSNNDAGCNCVWKKNGAVVQTNPVSNCNLVGATAGTYTMELTCAGSIVCTLTQAITEPAVIDATGVVTNEACAGKGGITLTPTGGTPAYTYLWTPGNITTKDISNIVAGNYTVVITDSKGCTATKMFTVTAGASPLTVNGTVTNVKCFGEANGAIALQVSGGCPNNSGAYNYVWTGPTPATGINPTSLAAGNYSVTVTDNSNPSMTSTKSFTIAAPTAALASTQEVTASAGTDGRIRLTITGGATPYSTVWTGPTAITNNTIDATGLAAGAYKVTITDNGGCVITKDITVPTSGGELTFLSMEITTANQFNGFAVSCFGLKNGVVTGSFSGGTPPFAVAYTGAGTGSKNVNVAGSFSFDKLGAGNYEFKITDASGMSKTRTIILTEPQRITVDVVRTCVNGIANDGAAAVTVTGGVPNYTYRWSNGSTESSISGLARGSYNSVIEDQNGCQVTAVARIVGCGDAENGCYSGLSIMTPNNDGYNDLFIINCATDVPGKLTVYDRYGKQVYQKDVYDNTWDGIDSSGQILPEGSYMWVLEVSFPSGIEIFTGTVTVLRD